MDAEANEVLGIVTKLQDVLKREKVAFAVCRIARRTLTAPLLFIQKPVDIFLVLDGVVVKRCCEERDHGDWVG